MMKSFLRISSVVMAASLFGVVSNLAAADPPSDWPNNMGPGMMGGYGPGYGMGPGMRGWGNYRDLNLSAEQESKITQIRQEMRVKQWPLMGQMMDAQDRLQELYDADKQDSAAIDKQYKVVDVLRRQMVDNAVDAHNRINNILTKEQREKSREWNRGGY
jgi:Spy/CpxP family protein refolding chaperone